MWFMSGRSTERHQSQRSRLQSAKSTDHTNSHRSSVDISDWPSNEILTVGENTNQDNEDDMLAKLSESPNSDAENWGNYVPDIQWLGEEATDSGLSRPSTSRVSSTKQEGLSPANGTVGSTSVFETITSVLEEPVYSFSPARRQEMLRQMNVDILRYSRQREEVFGKAHGYCMYYLDTHPAPEAPLKAAWFNFSIPSLIADSDSESDSSMDSHNTGISAALETYAETVGNLVVEEPPPEGRDEVASLASLRQNSFDITEDFFTYLLRNESRSHIPEGEDTFPLQLHELNLGYRQSLIPSGRQDLGSWNGSRAELDAYCWEEFSTLEGGAILADMIRRAVDDGMEIHEAQAFVASWYRLYCSNSRSRGTFSPITYRAVPLSVMMFWVALRRGWGVWRPSNVMIRSVRNLLRRHTGFGHQVVNQERSPTELLLFRREIMTRIEENLAYGEKDKLVVLFGRIEFDRINLILQN
ncbi:hypothetical protein DL95DRAFT_407479 [Leptodontidium sp. 2 PMI_412]|nr:hypothetical protein DL95DRAFT_407479 [Leptodontidium sp. 2 PMI_412]